MVKGHVIIFQWNSLNLRFLSLIFWSKSNSKCSNWFEIVHLSWNTKGYDIGIHLVWFKTYRSRLSISFLLTYVKGIGSLENQFGSLQLKVGVQWQDYQLNKSYFRSLVREYKFIWQTKCKSNSSNLNEIVVLQINLTKMIGSWKLFLLLWEEKYNCKDEESKGKEE